MAVFKVETKNKVDIDKKPRVYFTCHPEDFEKYFKKVCDDIFKTHDCAIYYTEDMSEVIAEDEKQVDLGRNNLFVVPVTFKLLSTPNRAMDEDIPYALKEHIQVLPIMMEPGIDEFYSKPDKFGELQYLNPYSTDLTEISYEEKLKKYLESVLISEELAKRVRAAFDAYIFLSYRKKDRKYANELMRLIHSNPECRDIAIWFDEFLTPGESFKENIEKILDDCELFTLLVTPQLLEKVVDENGEERDNYVISTELPLARKKKEEKGTDIFAVEMEKTDREALSSISIEDYTNPENADFRDRLLETISHIAIATNNTPEHNFLIGLAYLEGLDVEVDRERALELITFAAESGLPEAMRKLVTIYRNGKGGKCDYKKIIFWQNKLVSYLSSSESKDATGQSLELMDALWYLGDYYHEIGEYNNALEVFKKTLNIGQSCYKNPLWFRIVAPFIRSSKQRQKISRYVSISYEKCANMYERLDDTASAIKYYRKALSIKKNNYNPYKLNSVEDMLNCYKRIGIVQKQVGNFDKALHCFFKCLEYGKTICELYDLKANLAYIYNQIGMVYDLKGDVPNAVEFWNKAVKISMAILESEEDNTYILSCVVDSYNLIGLKQNDKTKARECHFAALEWAEQSLKRFGSFDALWQKAATLSFISISFLKDQDFTNSERYELNALQIREKLYDTFANDRSVKELSLSYMNLGYIYKIQKKVEKALKCYKKAYKLLLDVKNISISTEDSISTLLYLMAVVDDDHLDKEQLIKAYDYVKSLLEKYPYQKEIEIKLNLITELLNKC